MGGTTRALAQANRKADSMATLAQTNSKTRRFVSSTMDAVGERTGIEAILYRPGVFRAFDRYACANAPGFTARLLSVFGPVRYLDVGAGTGRYAERLRELGATADACEHAKTGRKMAAERGLEVLPFDLGSSPPGPSPLGYNVAFCLEVAEHVPPLLGDRLVEYLAGFPTVVFTAAHPGQGGAGHINEKPKEYWESRFAGYGHQRDALPEARFLDAPGDVPADWLLTNLMIFTRRP